MAGIFLVLGLEGPGPPALYVIIPRTLKGRHGEDDCAAPNDWSSENPRSRPSPSPIEELPVRHKRGHKVPTLGVPWKRKHRHHHSIQESGQGVQRVAHPWGWLTWGHLPASAAGPGCLLDLLALPGPLPCRAPTTVPLAVFLTQHPPRCWLGTSIPAGLTAAWGTVHSAF